MPTATATAAHLDARSATTCEHQLWHDHTHPRPTPPAAAADQARTTNGIRHETQVIDRLLTTHPDRIRFAGTMHATIAAVDAQTPIIVQAVLPDDPDRGLVGRADLLIRCGDGYLPVDIKAHHVLADTNGTSQASTVDDPTTFLEVPGTIRSSHAATDDSQLCHYTRMLQACGWHAGRNVGGIIGTDTDNTGTPLIIWRDLTQQLADWDDAIAIRLQVIADGPAEGPIRRPDCTGCPYTDLCDAQASPSDAAWQMPPNTLTVPQWQALRRAGTRTLSELAAQHDPTLPVTPHSQMGRVNRAARWAQLILDETPILAIDPPAEWPAADLEVDVDIEWLPGPPEHVYLWGARIRNNSDDTTAHYVPFVDWGAPSPERERALAVNFFTWLTSLAETHERAGHSVAIFHWGNPERSRPARILPGDWPVLNLFVDLNRVAVETFESVHGHGLKPLSRHAGFRWAAGDAGGDQSTWYAQRALAGDTDAQKWLLTYNEDDTAAQAAIRDRLR